MSSPRRLVLMRHAKAQVSAPTDVERCLTDSGHEDAAEAGVWLAALDVTPDCALVSAAERTRETWQAVSEGAGWHVDPSYDGGLYAAGPETALDLIRTVPTTCHTLVVIGHNPTIASLASLLDDGEGDVAAANEMAMGFPTCGLAVMSYDGEWSDLDTGAAAVVAFHVGRAG